MTSKTIASVGLVLILTALFATSADARSRAKSEPSEKLLKEMVALRKELHDIKSLLRGRQIASADRTMPMPRRNPLTVVTPMNIPDASKTLKGYERQIARSAKLKDLTPKLADKVAAILVNCPGSRLVSGYRRNAKVAGSGRPSLHSAYPSKAADLAGNPTCIRKMLAAWPGGLSTDYAAVRHYHVSYAPGGREWGSRFAHYRPRHHLKHNYASVQ